MIAGKENHRVNSGRTVGKGFYLIALRRPIRLSASATSRALGIFTDRDIHPCIALFIDDKHSSTASAKCPENVQERVHRS